MDCRISEFFFLLLWNNGILRNIWVFFGFLGGFFVHTMEVNSNKNSLVTSILQNNYFVFNRRKKVIQVWNDMRVCK